VASPGRLIAHKASAFVRYEITFNQGLDWISWDNQGANVAMTDLNGDASPELIVLRVNAKALLDA